MATPTIDGYRDLVRIGRGGFATVYRAHQERFGRTVALKVIDRSELDPRAAERFERECRAMGGLSRHPHVVAVHDAGVTADGEPWLAMEYLERGSLADRVDRDGPLPWTEAVGAVIQVAGALDAAHAALTLHRDLKPQNLLVGDFGEIKLSDFGLAAIEGGSRTTTGRAAFTLSHVAPEILRGARPDERTDLYGLGSTLHTLLTGAPPFGGEPGEPMATVMMRVLENDPPRLDDVPEALADLVQSLLAKDPAGRPASAGDVGRTLQALQAAEGQPVTNLILVGRAEPTEPAVTADPEPSPAPVTGDPRETVVVPATVVETAPAAPDPDITLSPLPAPPPTTPPPVAPPPPPPPPAVHQPAPEVVARPPRRWWWPVAAALVLIALVGGLVVATRDDDGGGGGEEGEEVAIGGDSGDSGPPPDLDVVATVDVPVFTDAVAVDGDEAWVVGRDGLVEVDAGSAEVVADFDVEANKVAARDREIWTTNGPDTVVTRFDPDSGRQTEVELERIANHVSLTSDSAWVGNGVDEAVTRIDRGTLEPEVIGFDEIVEDVVADEEGAYVMLEGSVARIDTDTNDITWNERVADGDTQDIAIGLGSVWVIVQRSGEDEVVRFDADTGEVIGTTAGDFGFHVTVGLGAVWVAGPSSDNVVFAIDPDSGEITGETDIGTFISDLTNDGESVWATADEQLFELAPTDDPTAPTTVPTPAG